MNDESTTPPPDRPGPEPDRATSPGPHAPQPPTDAAPPYAAHPTPYGVPVHAHPQVHVDPESAGMLRVEERGWALLFAALGAVTMVVALFLPWVRTGSEGQKARGDDDTAVDIDESTGLFDVVDTVRDSTGFAERGADPGSFSELFFPTLAIVATVVCVLVVLVAAFGLRRRALTNVARVLGVLVTGAVFLALAYATWDVDMSLTGNGTGGTATAEAAGDADPGPMDSWVFPELGLWAWLAGLALLALAATLGPRVVHRLPEGATLPGWPTGTAAAFAPGAAPGVSAVPGQAAVPGLPPGVPGSFPGLLHTTQTVAVVVAGLGAFLCLAGYGFLPWGPDTTFAEISDAIREHGLEDKPLTEAYFAWLGWAFLVAVAVVAVLVGLGRKPSGVRPKALRPYLAGTALVLTGVHLWVLVDLLNEGGELDAGSVAVTAGLALTTLGSLLPLRVSAPMLLGGPPPYTGGQPPGSQPPA